MHRFVNHFTAERGIKSYYDNSPFPPPEKRKLISSISKYRAIPDCAVSKAGPFPIYQSAFWFWENYSELRLSLCLDPLNTRSIKVTPKTKTKTH